MTATPAARQLTISHASVEEQLLPGKRSFSIDFRNAQFDPWMPFKIVPMKGRSAQTADIRDSFENTGCGRGPRGRSCCSPLAAPPSCTAQVEDRHVASRIRGLPGGATKPTESEISSGAQITNPVSPFPFWSPTGLSNCGHFLCGLNCGGDGVERAKSARKLQLESAHPEDYCSRWR